jgi:hypothetical protein
MGTRDQLRRLREVVALDRAGVDTGQHDHLDALVLQFTLAGESLVACDRERLQ